MDLDYNDDDFPDFDADVEEKMTQEVVDDVDSKVKEIALSGDKDRIEELRKSLNDKSYYDMTEMEFRFSIIGMLESVFHNERAINDATEKGFEVAEGRVSGLYERLNDLSKKIYGDMN